MADLFGAPLGIIAGEESSQRAALSGLQSLKLMREIEAQPADAEYMRRVPTFFPWSRPK